MAPASGSGPSKIGKITVDADERKAFRERRETLGLTQRQLATKVGTTNGTISNLENGKHPQIKWNTYARLRYVLFREKTTPDESVDAMLKELADKLPQLDLHTLKAVSDLIDGLKKPK